MHTCKDYWHQPIYFTLVYFVYCLLHYIPFFSGLSAANANHHPFITLHNVHTCVYTPLHTPPALHLMLHVVALFFKYLYILLFILVFKFHSSCTMDVRETNFQSSVSLVHTAELTIKLTLTFDFDSKPMGACMPVNSSRRRNTC